MLAITGVENDLNFEYFSIKLLTYVNEFVISFVECEKNLTDKEHFKDESTRHVT
jgi:hypothetical protein